MPRLLKCPVCGTMSEKENTKEHKKRYYCPECLDKKLEEAKKNSDGWEELYEYIYDLYGQKPTGRMFKQLGEYRKPPYNYTNTGILLTLKYFYEIMGNKVLEGTGIGIVAYVYEEAKQNYIKTMNINKQNLEIEYNDDKKYIQVKSTKHNNKGKIIDFENLEANNE